MWQYLTGDGADCLSTLQPACRWQPERRGEPLPPFHSPHWAFTYSSPSYLICSPSVLESYHRCLHLFEKAHLLTEKWTSMAGPERPRVRFLRCFGFCLNPHHPFHFCHCFLSGLWTLDTREERKCQSLDQSWKILEKENDQPILLHCLFLAKEQVKNCKIQPANYIWLRPGVEWGGNESNLQTSEKNKFGFIV